MPHLEHFQADGCLLLTTLVDAIQGAFADRERGVDGLPSAVGLVGFVPAIVEEVRMGR